MGYAGCGHTEFIQPQAEQDRGGFRITSHFTAHANPDTCFVAFFDDPFNLADDRRMTGIRQICHLFTGALSGHGVLGKIVGTDAEKVHFFGKQIRHLRRGGNFHHDADLDVIRNRETGREHFLTRLCQQGFGTPYFFQRRNHREHNAQVMPGAGAQQRTQLYFEEIGFIQAHADGAPTQERISFFTKVQIIQLFVAADVQRAYHHRAFFHDVQDSFVRCQLFFLSWGGGAFQVKELSPQ